MFDKKYIIYLLQKSIFIIPKLSFREPKITNANTRYAYRTQIHQKIYGFTNSTSQAVDSDQPNRFLSSLDSATYL